MASIAFLGLGIMGAPMAVNLVRAGFVEPVPDRRGVINPNRTTIKQVTDGTSKTLMFASL